LHTSLGAQQVSSTQPLVQLAVPDRPPDVVQGLPVEPWTQANVSSAPPTQSSSRPLQISAGGVQTDGSGSVQVDVQVPDPVDPHVVVQDTEEPLTHANVSSGPPVQSSSRPLQISAGGVHAHDGGMVHVPEQVPVPVVPHDVVHATAVPWTHGKVSSGPPMQSSSRPLQISTGGVHADGSGRVQVEEQTPVPVEPQVVVQGVGMLMAQGNPLSGPPVQSSSSPLQISLGGVHMGADGMEQDEEQVPVPVVPQIVVHVTGAPRTQA
jgi:hypothetical protein